MHDKEDLTESLLTELVRVQFINSKREMLVTHSVALTNVLEFLKDFVINYTKESNFLLRIETKFFSLYQKEFICIYMTYLKCMSRLQNFVPIQEKGHFFLKSILISSSLLKFLLNVDMVM